MRYLQKIGKMIRIPIFVFILIIICVAISIYSPFKGVDGGEYLNILILLGMILILAACIYFTPRAWMERRVRWLKSNSSTSIWEDIWKIGKGSRKMLTFYDQGRHMSYEFHPAEKHFYICRTMFLNPAHYEKEYKERKEQIREKMDQGQIPYERLSFDCGSCLCFTTVVILDKQNATKDYVCRIRDIMVELAKADYAQNVYFRYEFDERIVYCEINSSEIIRCLLIYDGEKEYYTQQEEEEQDAELSDWLIDAEIESSLLHMMPENLILQEDFEKIWEDE